MFLFSILEAFVGSNPISTRRKPDRRTGKTYDSLIFKTLTFPCLNELRIFFYPLGPQRGHRTSAVGEGNKIVPENIGLRR